MPHTNKGAAIPAEHLVFTDTPQASKAVAVLPAGDHGIDIEDHLRDNLPPDIGEVDGNLMNPEGTEILVYAANPTAAATRIRAMLEGQTCPPEATFASRSTATIPSPSPWRDPQATATARARGSRLVPHRHRNAARASPARHARRHPPAWGG